MMSTGSTSSQGSSPLTRGKRARPPKPPTAPRLIPAHAGKTINGQSFTFPAGAHPRSRGENQAPHGGRLRGLGSSPLTRGKRPPVVSSMLRPGLIPAHAGKTISANLDGVPTAAHPRSRGENRTVTLYARGDLGSSPLTRGKRFGGFGGVSRVGLIPAHAGKTGCLGRIGGRRGAHPRSRGENIVRLWGRVERAGSSPLTRGKPRRPPQPVPRARLIPAHAGKTQVIWGTTNDAVGSSPLTRGKPSHSRRERCGGRLIPAHAGKTVDRATFDQIKGAHPRSRGENLIGGCLIAPGQGSSPLTRGKRSYGEAGSTWDGLIPAHAGKTLTRPPRSRTPRAHPRSRGENAASERRARAWKGSSPLTRGKRLQRRAVDGRAGLIPAHAGKTIQFRLPPIRGRAHPRSRGENCS